MPCEGRALRRPCPVKAVPCEGRALWNWQGVPSLLMYKMPLKFHRLKTPRDFMLPHSPSNPVLPVTSIPPFPRWRKVSELKEGTSTACQSRPDVEESWGSVHKHSSSLVVSVCCWTSPLPSANCPWVRECSGFQLTIGLYFQDSAARWLPLDLTKGLWVLRNVPTGSSVCTLGPQLVALLGRSLNFETVEPCWRGWVTEARPWSFKTSPGF